MADATAKDDPDSPPLPLPRRSASAPAARWAVAAAGCGAAAAQVVLLRELMVASAGNELSLGGALSSWLLWSALGAWLGGRHLGRRGRRPAAAERAGPDVVAGFQHMALASAAATLAGLLLSRALLHMLRLAGDGALVQARLVPPPGGVLSLPQVLVLCAVAIGLPAVCFGAQFAAGCRLLASSERPAAATAAEVAPAGRSEPGGPDAHAGASHAYVLDSLGHLAGGAALSMVVLTRVAPGWLVAAGVLLALGAAAALRPRPAFLGAAVALVLAAAAGQEIAGFAWGERLRWQPYALKNSRYGPVGNVAVLEQAGGELSFFSNGVQAFETAEAYAGEQWVHLALVAHPSPRRVLLVGGGPRCLGEVLAHGATEVNYVEVDRELIAAARAYAPTLAQRSLDRVHVHFGDGRRWVRRLAGEPRSDVAYDVVLIALPAPSTALLNRYYTEEWFRALRALLAPEGIVAFQALSANEYLGPHLAAYDACLLRTAEASGLKARALPGDTMTVIAWDPRWAQTNILAHPAQVLARLRGRGLPAQRLAAAFYDALDPSRQERLRARLDQVPPLPVNRDLHPVCYYYAQVLWASWFGSLTADVLARAQSLRPVHCLALLGLAAAVFVVICAGSRRPGPRAAAMSMLLAGGVGMALEVTLLLALQTLSGVVYGLVGYAIGAQMAGLALGAWLGRRASATARRAGWTLCWSQIALGAVAAGACSGGVLLSAGVGLAWNAAAAVLPLLMAATGVLVGLQFPAAVRLASGAQPQVSGATALYAADLVGACVGALVASLVVVPLLGMLTSLGLAGVAAVVPLPAAIVALRRVRAGPT